MAYQTINTIFQKNEMDLMASEAHGLATGMLCIDHNMEVAHWLAELFSEEMMLVDDDKTILVALFEQTRRLLADEEGDFRYDLFLPSEDEPLAEQLEALRVWCEGFLFGVSYTRSSAKWPGESRGIMHDIVEFTKLDSGIDQDRDEQESYEDEAALMEIQEYLRAAVIMLRDQFFEEHNELNTPH